MIFVPTILLAYCTAVCWQLMPWYLIYSTRRVLLVVTNSERGVSVWSEFVEFQRLKLTKIGDIWCENQLFVQFSELVPYTMVLWPDQRSSNIPNWWLGFVSSKVWVWESNFISFNNKKGLVSLVEPQLNLLLLQVFTALKFSFLRTLQREDRVTGFSRFQELRPALQS